MDGNALVHTVRFAHRFKLLLKLNDQDRVRRIEIAVVHQCRNSLVNFYRFGLSISTLVDVRFLQAVSKEVNHPFENRLRSG